MKPAAKPSLREELMNAIDIIRRLIERLLNLLEPHGWDVSVAGQAGTASPALGQPYRPVAVPASETRRQSTQRRLGRTRCDKIRMILRAAEGTLTTKGIIEALKEGGDMPPGSSARSYYNTVDSALRDGEGTYFRKVARATWTLLDTHR